MKKRRMTKRFKVILTVAAVAYALTIFVAQESEFKKLGAESEALKTQLSDAQMQVEALQHKIDYTSTDAYMEKTARDTLGWIKDGEIKFTVEE